MVKEKAKSYQDVRLSLTTASLTFPPPLLLSTPRLTVGSMHIYAPVDPSKLLACLVLQVQEKDCIIYLARQSVARLDRQGLAARFACSWGCMSSTNAHSMTMYKDRGDEEGKRAGGKREKIYVKGG